jgi:FMN reductase
MLKTTVVVGNPKPASRTRKIAELVARNLLGGVMGDFEVFDLAEHTHEIFAWPSDTMGILNKRVADSNLAIFASPTYKASYTGLLKAFLDRYPANGLKNVVAISLMTGADLGHSMAPTVNLIPLLLELGATVPVRGLYFNTSEMDRIEEVAAVRTQEIVSALTSLCSVAQFVGRDTRADGLLGVQS